MTDICKHTDCKGCVIDNGSMQWLKDGVRHRTDGPALVYPYGAEMWYIDGLLHRDNGPAVTSGQNQWWYCKGKHHRLDGPAIITPRMREWYQDDLKHRVEGPAVIYNNGDFEWYVRGKMHRTDGPACTVLETWYLNDQPANEKEVLQVAYREVYEVAIALLQVDLPPYCLLWILEYVNALIAVKRHHATIRLLEGLWRSRNKIKTDSNS